MKKEKERTATTLGRNDGARGRERGSTYRGAFILYGCSSETSRQPSRSIALSRSKNREVGRRAQYRWRTLLPARLPARSDLVTPALSLRFSAVASSISPLPPSSKRPRASERAPGAASRASIKFGGEIESPGKRCYCFSGPINFRSSTILASRSPENRSRASINHPRRNT